jgi:hypothetical protein
MPFGGSRLFLASDGCLRNHGETDSPPHAALVAVERIVDPPVPDRSLAFDAPGVHAEKYLDAVPGAAGHFGCWHPGVQREGHSAVPKIVRAGRER